MAANRKRKKNDKDGPGLFDTPEVYKDDSVYWQRCVADLKKELDQTKKDLNATKAALDQRNKELDDVNSALNKKTIEHDSMVTAHSQLSRDYNKLKDKNNADEDTLDNIQKMLDNNKSKRGNDTSDGYNKEYATPYASKCFKHPDKSVKEMVKAIVSSYYFAAHKDMALIEIALFDHSIIKQRNEHKLFVNALIEWEVLPELSDDEIKKLINGMTNKFSHIPREGYKEWDSYYHNDRGICECIGRTIGPTMPYTRYKK